MNKRIIGIALLSVLTCAANATPIVYDITLSGIDESGNPVGGAAVATFSENAFDADGIFTLSGNLLDFSVSVDGFIFAIAEIPAIPHIEYHVAAGELFGFDWIFENPDTILFSEGWNEPLWASPLTGPVILHPDTLTSPCGDSYCYLTQEWNRRSVMVPEPTTAALLGLGLAGIAWSRRVSG